MLKIFAAPLLSLFEQAYDSNRAHVNPVPGSVVYCDLLAGYAEHSGLYLGHNEIVQLNGDGLIEVVSPREFMRGTTGGVIYVSSIDNPDEPIRACGSQEAAQRARDQVGLLREYKVFTNNCHQFVMECLTGKADEDSFLWILKDRAHREIGANDWRVGDF